MQIWKTKAFQRWANDEGVTDQSLVFAVDEMQRGLVDADLGGQVYKKRIRLKGRGKRGGARVILAFRFADRAFFVYGFAKSQCSDISQKELKALKRLARELLGYSVTRLARAAKAGELVEVVADG